MGQLGLLFRTERSELTNKVPGEAGGQGKATFLVGTKEAETITMGCGEARGKEAGPDSGCCEDRTAGYSGGWGRLEKKTGQRTPSSDLERWQVVPREGGFRNSGKMVGSWGGGLC